MTPYRGRFAPTPSGPLHFGSLVTAVGSYLDARRNRGEWLVRIEDLDPPRVVPGAADDILRALEAFGFEWDGEVLLQSFRTDAHLAAFERLRSGGLVYPCRCSRAMAGGAVCGGACRNGLRSNMAVRSWRARFDGAEPGCDFVLRRGDGIFSYDLAVAVDDSEQGITHVVRGADLIEVTPRQTWLQRQLGFRTPEYLHLPLARNERGEKLSKQTHAPAISRSGSSRELTAALKFLGQELPPEPCSVAEIWRWAIAEWRPELVPLYAATESTSMSGAGDGLPKK